MATKAEQHKAEAQRKAHLTRKAKPSARSVTASRSRTSRSKPDVPNPTSHNASMRAAKNSPYELEVSQTTRPSRKSTRRSPTHVKPDSPLRITTLNQVVSPGARAERRKG